MNKSESSLAVIAILLATGVAGSADLPDEATAKHMGVATCAASQCHGSAVPREGSNVMQNEYVTWTRDDPHGKAFETLNSDLSRAIAARLGLASARSADICLDCHADNVTAARRGERFQLSDGVGCEACHGGAENWLSTHYNVPAVSHADNIAAGLYPTETPPDRAKLCLSCHLGTENKFATHRIMAAGHPRLAFELDTFTELWRTAGRQPHYQVDADYVERKGEPSHVHTWASGVIADARQRLALVRGPSFAVDGLFPELGLYDCHACHRTMKSVQWRRLPRHGNAGPGMPFLSDGTFVMAHAIAKVIEPGRAGNLWDSLRALHVAGGQSVTEIRAAASALDAELQRLERLATRDRMQASRRAILQSILETASAGDFLDYASAEQAFMAVQMLAIELGDRALEAALDDLARSLEDDERYRPAQFARLLNRADNNE